MLVILKVLASGTSEYLIGPCPVASNILKM